MSENPEEHTEDHEKLRNLLRRLPKVQASPDFEQRLLHRLDEARRTEPRRGWLKRIPGPRRIPAFAYSLATLLVVGLISYYAFFRNGVPEQFERPQMSQRTDSLLFSTPAAPHPEGPKSTAETAVPGPAGNEQGEVAPSAVPSPAKKNIAGRPQPPGEVTVSGEALTKAEREVNVPPETRAAAVPESASFAAKSEMRLQDANEVAQRRVAAPQARPLLKGLVSAPETGYQASPSPPLSTEMLLKKITGQIDSLGTRDSLKRDSLERLRRYLQMQLQKEHIRKPSKEE